MTPCHRYLGTEMDISIRYNVPATSDAVEIMHHIRHINNTLSTPGDATEVGKEVISRIITDLDTQGVMFTDTNGVHTLKRIRNHRDTWTLNSSEPISDNYYPVNARAYAPPPLPSLQQNTMKNSLKLQSQLPPWILRRFSRHRHRPLPRDNPSSSSPSLHLMRQPGRRLPRRRAD
jgi:hypothetical protein